MKKAKKIYISGPISGLPRLGYMAYFGGNEKKLKEKGWKVVNPTRLFPCRWPWLYRIMGYRLTLLYDLWHLSRCDAIAMLPGWEYSRGANIEIQWASVFGIKIVNPYDDYDYKLVKSQINGNQYK